MGIDPSSFSRSAASARAQLKLEARLAAKQTNRKEIDRNSTQTAFLNQTERRLRTTDVVSKSINGLLESFSTATDGLNTVKGNLEEIRGIIDSALKGTLGSSSTGQSRINELVNQIKSITETVSYGGKKIFAGDFSYSAILNTKNNIYNKSFVNNSTNSIAPPTPSNTGYAISSLGNIGGEGGQGFTDGLRWNNQVNFADSFDILNAPEQALTSNDRYIVRSGRDTTDPGLASQLGVYDKITGALVQYVKYEGTDPLNQDGSYGDLISLNNNNKLAVASDNGIYLEDISTMGSIDPIELKDENGNSIAGINSLDISGDYIVAGRSDANGGVAYIFNANTGAYINKITDTAAEPYSSFARDVAIDGNKIVIAANYSSTEALFDEGIPSGGYLKVYELAGTTISESRRINISRDASFQPSNPIVPHGHATSVDFEDGKIITNAGNHSLIFDANTGSQLGSFNHVPASASDKNLVFNYELKNGRVAVQTTNRLPILNIRDVDVQVFDINNFKTVNELYISNNSKHLATDGMLGSVALTFDGTNLYWHRDEDGAIGRSTLETVSNAIRDQDAYGKKVLASGDFLISLSPGRDEGGLRETGSIFVYNKNTGSLVKEFKNISSVSTQFNQTSNTYLDNFEISASGNRIALLDKAGNSASVFNISTNQVNKFAIDAADDTIAIDANRRDRCTTIR